jgi:hypothetical protein
MSWYTEGAMFTKAQRCNDCGAYADPRDKAELERERRLWTEADAKGLSFEEAQKQVCLQLYLPVKDSKV